MKEIEFKPEHVELVEIVGEDKEFCTKANLMAVAEHPSSTFVDDGRVVAFAGIVVTDYKVGNVWLLPTKYLEGNFIGLAKAMKYYVTHLPEIYNLKTLCTSGHKDKRVKRWLLWLGFEYDDNLKLYSKVR